MLNISELKGQRLKKDCCLDRVIKRWHNRNKSGGNFGINLITGNAKNYEITGYHDLKGNVYHLTLGELYQGVGLRLIDKDRSLSYDQVVKLIKLRVSGASDVELCKELV